MISLEGVYPAILVPYLPDGRINGRMLARIVEAHIQAGVHGFYASGATGEGILQTVEERIETARIVVEQVRGRCRVVAHVGAVSTKDTLQLAKTVALLGIDAISALPPIFYRVPFQAVVDSYMQIGCEVGLPTLVYYIPGTNFITFKDDQFERLLNIDNVVGLKFTDHDLFLMQQILARRPDTVLLSGYDQIFLPALSMGAHGAIGLTLNMMPALYVKLYQAFLAGDLKKAQELQYKANRVTSIVVQHDPIASLKPIMKMMGFDCGVPRSPLPQLDRSVIDRIHGQLTGIGFFSDPIYSGWAKGDCVTKCERS